MYCTGTVDLTLKGKAWNIYSTWQVQVQSEKLTSGTRIAWWVCSLEAALVTNCHWAYGCLSLLRKPCTLVCRDKPWSLHRTVSLVASIFPLSGGSSEECMSKSELALNWLVWLNNGEIRFKNSIYLSGLCKTWYSDSSLNLDRWREREKKCTSIKPGILHTS
jgi:hypothetical protein